MKTVRIPATGKGEFIVLSPSLPAKVAHSGSFVLQNLGLRGAQIQVQRVPNAHIEELAAGNKVLALTFHRIVGCPVGAIGAVRCFRQLGNERCSLDVEFTDISKEHAHRLQTYLATCGVPGTQDDRPYARPHNTLRPLSRFIVAAAAVVLGIAVGYITSRTPPAAAFHAAP